MDERTSIPSSTEERNTFSRRVAGSLAQRVLFMGLILLGLPLLIHTFYLYHREYQDNVDDAFITLRSLAESRALYVEQMVQNQLNIIQALIDELPNGSEERDQFLKKEAKQYEVDDLFFVAFGEDEAPVCDDLFCQDSSFVPLLKQADSTGTFIFINPNAKEKNAWLYVGRYVDGADLSKGALVVATPTDRLLSRLAYREYTPYSIGVSIIDERGDRF